MKTLNRHNLALAKLAPKDSRFISGVIQVTPDDTRETDGHQCLIITTVENGNAGEKADFKPFLLPRSLALQMAHDMPAVGIQPRQVSAKTRKREAAKPTTTLKIAPEVNGEATMEFVAGDVSSTIRVKQVGKFPNIDVALETKRQPVVLKIRFNPKILANVFAVIATFAEAVTLEFSADNEAVVLSATNHATGQALKGLVMPMRLLD
jgi:hypothetical protein